MQWNARKEEKVERRGDLLVELSDVSCRLFDALRLMEEVDARAADANGVMAVWTASRVVEDITRAHELHTRLYALAQGMDAWGRQDLEDLVYESAATLNEIARRSARLAERARDRQARERALRARWSWRARQWLLSCMRVLGRWMAGPLPASGPGPTQLVGLVGRSRGLGPGYVRISGFRSPPGGCSGAEINDMGVLSPSALCGLTSL